MAVEWDTRGCTDGERLLLWTTAAAVPAETLHSNCERWQLKAVVEWDAARHTDGERLWTGCGGDSGGSGQQLGTMAVAGSSKHLAKMADGCVNRNMTNMGKFGFSEYVSETEKRETKYYRCDIMDIGNPIILLFEYLSKKTNKKTRKSVV